MMDGTAIATLEERFRKPFHMEINGRPVLIAPEGWNEVLPQRFGPQPLAVGTLDALVAYLWANKDGLPLDKVLVHVASPTSVRVIGALEDEPNRFRRNVYLAAEAVIPKIPFGQYLDAESFGIALRTGFVDGPTVQEIVALVASIRESDVRETLDDGVAQEVKVARGVALVDRQRVPSPVGLAPYRTFIEVEQPESPFILRLRSGANGGSPTCALFEADGGAWRLAALQGIVQHLTAKMAGEVTDAGVRILV